MELKIQVFYLFLLLIAESFTKQRIRRHLNDKPHPRNCTYEHINADVYLLNSRSPSDGLVKIATPLSHELLTVCYPRDTYTSNKEVAMLSHAVCRHLGYMTFSSGYQHNVPIGMESISVQANIICKETAQSLRDCSWCNKQLNNCSNVLATQCTGCRSVLEASEGFITNPGNPYVYLYTVQCQWDIIVPEGHGILLTFRQLFLPESRWGSMRCEFGQSHVEISYEAERTTSVQRYCKFSYVRTVKVPDRKVTVRFYSGIDSGSIEGSEKQYGFNLLFQAEPMDQTSLQSFKFIVIAGISITILVLMGLCYCCRKIGTKYRRNQSFRRAASRKNSSVTTEAGSAATHQRPDFSIAIDKENRFVPPQEIYTRSLGAKQETLASNSQETYHQHEVSGTEQVRTTALGGTPYRQRRKEFSHEKRNGGKSKLRTNLFSRFASINNSIRNSFRSKKEATPPRIVIPQVTNSHVYNSFTSKSRDSAAESLYECPKSLHDEKQATTIISNSDAPREFSFSDDELSKQHARVLQVPKIIIECVDELDSDEDSMSSEEKQYLKPSL